MLIDLDRSHVRILAAPRVALAGASLIAALALGSPAALAACGGTVPTSTGSHAPSSGNGGLHTTTSAPASGGGSAGGSSCGVTTNTKTATGSAAGPVHFSTDGVSGHHTWTHSANNANNWHSHNGGSPHWTGTGTHTKT
jgi:hypothetical protein